MLKLKRLLNCISHLGFRLGYRYWKLQNRALLNPDLLLEWARNCDEAAVTLEQNGEGVLSRQYLAWAAELRASYHRFMTEPKNIEPDTL